MANKDVQYLAHDFSTFVSDFKNFIKSQYPNTYKDFSDSSSGMMIGELLAYGNDILSFYINRVYNELIFDNAVDKNSIYSIARMLGYKPQKKAASLVEETLYVNVPATYDSGIPLPNYQYAPVVKRGSTLASTSGIKFEILYDVDFSTSTGSLNYVPSVTNSTTGLVEYFALKKNVLAISAQTKKKTFNLKDFIRFRKLAIDDSDAISIFDVMDTDGNRWYEVDYLAQNTVFESSVNTNYDNDLVPYVMKIKKVPRRFVTEFDYKTGYISLNFGSGKEDSSEDSIMPTVAEISIPLYGKSYFTGYSIDPQNFLNTKTLGLSPYNTVLDVYYRAGGGASSVVAANSINRVDNLIYEFKYTGLDSNEMSKTINSIAANNSEPSQGGRDEHTIFEIKQYAKASFAAQMRCVTANDYIARVFSMPSVFGSVCKANIKKNCKSPNIIDLYVLAYDSNKNYIAPTTTLQKNLKTYLREYTMLSDTIQISPAGIINFTIDFVIVCEENANRNAILSQCINTFRSYFDKDNRQIGEPIIKSRIIKALQNIVGIYSVSSVNYSFDNSSLVRDKHGVIYCPDGYIFEISNFNTAIKGKAL